MPKEKYLHNKKEQYRDGLNQEELDKIFFNSPKYAEMIGKKFGRNTKAIEDSFAQYFKVLKNLGITELIDPNQAKRVIDRLEFIFVSRMESKNCEAFTTLTGKINIRNSFSADIKALFHEFNHALSVSTSIQRSKNKANGCKWWISCGYKKMDVTSLSTRQPKLIKTSTEKSEKEIDGKMLELTPQEFDDLLFESFLSKNIKYFYQYFSEGVTEYLAILCMANIYKKPMSIGAAYTETIAYIHSLYLTFGNSLFEGYFNDGNFFYMAKTFIGDKNEHKKIEEEIKDLASLITDYYTELYNSKNFSKFMEMDLQIREKLLALFSRKMIDEVVLNIKEFGSSEDIFISLLNAYAEYGKNLTFGFHSASPLNLNRKSILQGACLSLAETIENLKDISLDKTRSKLLSPEDIKKLESIDTVSFNELETLFNDISELCKSNYGMIPCDTKPISPVDYIYGREVEFADKNKNSYNLKRAPYLRVCESTDGIWSTKYHNFMKYVCDLEEPDLFEELKAKEVKSQESKDLEPEF